MGRPLEFDSEQVLDAAMHLFWLKGFEATSLQDLVGAMGLARSSLYQTFGSKRDLFLTCLDRYGEMTTLDLANRLTDAATGQSFIEGTLLWAIEEVVEPTRRMGCLVVTTANECGQRDSEVADHVSGGFDRFHAVFAASLERGQEDGSIRRDRSVEVLASYLVANMSGLRTLVKSGKDLEELRGIVAVVMAAL